MKGRLSRHTTWFSLLLILTAAPAWAQSDRNGFDPADFDRTDRDGRQLLIKADDLGDLPERYGFEVLRRHVTKSGTLWLVEMPSGAPTKAAISSLAASVTEEENVTSATGVSLASLPVVTLSTTEASDQTHEDVSRQGKVWSPCLGLIDPTGVWRGYANQRAVQITHLHLGHHADQYWCGRNVVVAVIDTAVDATHPLLEDAMVDGYDFVEEAAGLEATQTSSLDTRTRAIVESNESVVIAGLGAIEVIESAAVIMGEYDSEASEDVASQGQFYGHGTMVAGLIRLTAPGARIMPLEAFDSQGVGHPFDIVRAIDYAVDNGAHVINMSFSITDASPELLEAVERARLRGVMTVAAAGNSGEASFIYPAAYGATIGVAATDFDNQLTDFSNYGLLTADIAAPGAGVVTTFPGGLFATGWGTSFSTPLVSGTVALVRTYHTHLNQVAHKKTRLEVLLGGVFYTHLWTDILSSSRADTLGAILEARK